MNRTEDNKQAFSRIVLMHISALNRYALSLCKSEFDADDLVSATVLKALEHFPKLKDASRAKQWLFRILSNQFITNYRSGKKFVEIERNRQEHTNGKSESFSLFEALAESDFVADGNPEKQFIGKLTQEQIKDAIAGLPEEYRSALVLCDMEEFSYAEISDILNVPIGTVRSRIARARTLLQKKLWLQARELGIGKSKRENVVKEYVCTCGKEEIENIATTAQ